jgi:hypothetical protein
MFIIADPRGYHEPPSGPEAIRRNFCSADTCDAENKKHTAKAKNVNKFNFFMMFLPSLNLFDLNRPGDQQKPGERGAGYLQAAQSRRPPLQLFILHSVFQAQPDKKLCYRTSTKFTFLTEFITL